MKHSLSLAMSQIIACDAPLLSPTDAQSHWEPLFSPSHDTFTYAYYNLPPSPPLSDNHPSDSPVPANRMLKMRTTADSADLCMPTHQVFDFPQEIARPPTPPSRSRSLSRPPCHPDDQSDSMSSCGDKRSASPGPSASKKRAVGERISSKDFIPPDVSGLSKREARLVKNRAAAFLSRQRKREEFELMEVRVAELEQENARLLALTQNGSVSPPLAAHSAQPELVSEVEILKAQLAAAREREHTLSTQLASSLPVPVKLEAPEPHFSSLASPSSRSTTVSSAHKSGASLGLMVLLCALPTLLSMRMQSTAPTSFAIPNPFPASSASAFDVNSFLPNDYDWSKSSSSLMDLDPDQNHNRIRKLEFTGTDSSELSGLGLGDLDISFDTSPSDDGKIRVRIHSPSSSAPSRSGSPGASSSSYDAMKLDNRPSSSSSSSSLAMWSGKSSESILQASFPSQFNSLSSYSSMTSTSSLSSSTCSDPFLGSTSEGEFCYPPFASDGTVMYDSELDSTMGMNLNYGQMSDSPSTFGFGSEYSLPDSTGAKRRVRIALKSMPQAGGEGGEWEVQIC